MKRKEDIGIKELFEVKLEYSEVSPSASVRDELMKKLERREFVRFNPSRFNIYYLGLIVAAAITAGIMLFQGNQQENKNQDTPASELIVQENISSILRPGIGNNNISSFSISKPRGVTKLDTLQHLRSVQVPIQTRENSPSAIKRSLSVNELYPDNPVNRNLQKQNSPGKLIIQSSVSSGCLPLKIHFSANMNKSDSCSWSFGDGGYSTKKAPDWIFDEEGEYRVMLTVHHNSGPASMASVLVTVHPRPQGRFETTPENPQIPDDQIQFLNYSNDAISYKWDFGDGNVSEQFEPVHKYSRFGSYNVSLVLTSEYGCIDSVFIENAFAGSGNFIEMPNAFIPNPDGPSGGLYSAKSDEAARIFHPVFAGVAEYQLRIFSKLGLLLFESHDINIGWDGYFKGQLSNPGVYIWKIRGAYRNGEPFIMMGDVTLLKD